MSFARNNSTTTIIIFISLSLWSWLFRFDSVGEPEPLRSGHGGGSFDYDDGSSGHPRSSKMDPLSAAVSVKSSASAAAAAVNSGCSGLAGSDTGSDEDEEAPWIDKAMHDHAEADMEDEVEDLHKREEVRVPWALALIVVVVFDVFL